MNNIFNIIKNKLHYKSQNCDKTYFTYQAYIILFLLGLIIIFLRSAYNIMIPIIYTEDGLWIGNIINNGFWHAFFNVKGTYLVSANMICLYCAYLLNKLFFGYNISNLPLFVVLIQYILYSLVAILPVFVFKKHIKKIFLLFIWLSILLLPLGNSSFEIFGKISNIGFLFYFIAFCFLFYRIENREKLTILQIIFIDFILLICCTTNPVCYILLLLGGLIDIYMQRQVLMPSKTNISIGNTIKIFLQKFSNKSWIILGFLCLINILYHMFFQNSVIIDMPKDKSIHWMAYLLRISFYPLIYPFYDQLNDTKAGILLGIIIIYFLFVYIKADKKDKIMFIILLFAFLLYSFFTTYARPIMAILYSYKNTFPDRYVYALNIQFMLLFFYALNILYKINNKSKYIAVIMGAYFILINIINIKSIVQFYNNWAEIHHITFKQRINEATSHIKDTNNESVRINTEFTGWTIEVPLKYLICSYIEMNDLPDFLQLSNINNIDWENGINKNKKNILVMDGKYYNFLKLFEKLKVNINNKEYSAKIINIEQNTQYIHIITDIPDASMFAYPAKIEYELK